MRRTKGIAKEVHGCYRKTSVLKPRKFDRHGSTIVYWHSHACNCRKFFSTFLTLLGKRKFYLEEFFIIWESIWSNIQCIWSLSQLRWWGPNTNLKATEKVIRDILTFVSFIPSWVKQTLELKASKKKKVKLWIVQDLNTTARCRLYVGEVAHKKCHQVCAHFNWFLEMVCE